jgi:hypothetical protein
VGVKYKCIQIFKDLINDVFYSHSFNKLKHVLAPKIEVPDSKKYNYNKKGHKYCGLFYYDVAELFH